MRADPAGLTARRLAARLLHAVLVERQPLDEVFATEPTGALARLAERDRGFVRAIVATTLRRLGQIDDLLARFLDRPLPERAGLTRQILRTATTQLVFLDTGPHAAIDLAVRLAAEQRRTRPYKGLVNAVLRRVAREGAAIAAGQPADELNTPDWLRERWRAHYGDERARAITAAHLVEPALDLSVAGAPEPWAERLGAAVLPNGSLRLPGSGRVDTLAGFADGAWWVQDAAASLPARLFGDIAGKRVLDLCAAPGGKTAQLAAAGAQVIAVDRSPERLARLTENMARLGLAAETHVADATTFAPDRPVDAILLDAPCSATGTIRRHPDVAWLKTPQAVAAMAQMQDALLNHAADLLADGGLLVYCTCSLEPEEGEQRIDALLAARTDLERVPIEGPTLAGLPILAAGDGTARTLPCADPAPGRAAPGLDGFFLSRLRRRLPA